MPVKLFIRSVLAPAAEVPLERQFDQDVVTIGRKESNAIQLHDQRRLVSGRHAEIRRKDRLFTLIDLGSKNGTELNGQRIDAGKEYPLKEDDQIAISEFIIQLHILEPAAIPENAWQNRLDVTTFSMDVTGDVQELAADLCEIHWEYLHADSEVRKARMAEAIQRIVERHDETNSMKILDLIEPLFPEPQYQQEKVLQGFSRQTMECKPEEYEIYRTASEGLLKIAGRYIDNLDGLKSISDTNKLIDRIDRTMEVMIDCLGSAIKGRKTFEQEFDVEATRIFSWKPNPIKMVEDNREIGRYLLDWRGEYTLDKAASDLADAFTDLALHQMGLMAGFKECLRGILKQLDPVSLEDAGRERPTGVGPLKILCRFWPLASVAAWNRFRERHRELSEEEVKTFETILGPHFAKGYLSVQEKKKST